MRDGGLCIGLRGTLMISMVAILVMTSTFAVAQKERVLHSFNSRDGAFPYGSLIFDSSGNLYGTTMDEGVYDSGDVFELSPTEAAIWTETILYSFDYGIDNDGSAPNAGVIFDAAGNLYGTTVAGGAYYGGTVFELSPTADGNWTETILYSFMNNGLDGQDPESSLTLDAAGNLYGTTYRGGTGGCSYGCGTVFEVSPVAGGGWTETVLHTFGTSGSKDGQAPYGSLIFDALGNLYGTTSSGGAHGCGTVFELSPTAGGKWTETVLHSFDGPSKDGAYPFAGLIFDNAGNLYGTTNGGGAHDFGTVFELTPVVPAAGSWSTKVLHSFNGRDGYAPLSSLIFDASGHLYGTTFWGGNSTCETGCGVVFELTPNPSGWTEKRLSFNGKDGSWPYAGPIFDTSGNLYGTATHGGSGNTGVVFEIAY